MVFYSQENKGFLHQIFIFLFYLIFQTLFNLIPAVFVDGGRGKWSGYQDLTHAYNRKNGELMAITRRLVEGKHRLALLEQVLEPLSQ